MNKLNLTIIDSSSILYIICYNLNKDETNSDDFSKYKEYYDNYFQGILEDTKADYYIAFGDGYTSFRKQKFNNFKADRKSKPIPKFLNDLKQYAIDKWNSISSNKLEADDLCIIHSNYYNKEYNVTIASIDGDLRQEQGLYFDYQYKRKKIPVHQAFEVLSEEIAEFNLWKYVLIKGHNNSIYLHGCGEETAKKYLVNFLKNTRQLKLAVLNAYIHGIDKKKHNTPRNVKGYGLIKGISEFSKAFEQTYLLRTLDEAYDIDDNFDIIKPIEIIKEIETNEKTKIPDFL